jgi:UDP-N-acetylglucosamine 4-epimerase
MSAYKSACATIRQVPRRWLVTGVAGFIGSHLLEHLLRLGQTVIGVDNFSTGKRSNLDHVLTEAGAEAASRFVLFDGDICDFHLCRAASDGVEIVLHQAALGSVPRSVEDPLASHASNVDGFMNVLVAAREAGVRRLVYASSSSVYGDDASGVKVEPTLGRPLSPYAATKLIDELYADVFARVYGLEAVGLRYFNVFGPRQDPKGQYAAVIPRWIEQLLRGRPCELYGTSEKSRDFCYVENVVQANLLAGVGEPSAVLHGPYNVACGRRTTLAELFAMIRDRIAVYKPAAASGVLEQLPARIGDIEHSLASIERARKFLGYEPTHDVEQGLGLTVDSYIKMARRRRTTGGSELVGLAAPGS